MDGIVQQKRARQYDVDEGRRTLNFSEWQRTYEEAGDSAETIMEGEMTPAIYLVSHSSARLSPAEKDTLAQGLRITVGAPSLGHD